MAAATVNMKQSYCNRVSYVYKKIFPAQILITAKTNAQHTDSSLNFSLPTTAEKILLLYRHLQLETTRSITDTIKAFNLKLSRSC